MRITTDWHIHSHNSCDGACMAVPDLVSGAAEKGILDFGLTDHIHTAVNLPDLEASRRDFDAYCKSPHMHFGVEASCMSQWELDEVAAGRCEDPCYGIRSGGPPSAPLALGLAAEHIATLSIEYVVAGTHWPMYVPMEREPIIREFQRQNMFLACHPLVNIVAHPWWWHGHWQNEDGSYSGKPWLDDFRVVPQSMHDEFAAAAIERGKVVEINICAVLLHGGYPDTFKRQYMDYVAGLRAAGVSLSIGSDCHSAQYGIDFEAAAAMLDSVGIQERDLWRLPPRGEGLGHPVGPTADTGK